MQDLFERHPLPWKCDEVMSYNNYFIKDAKGDNVTLIKAVDETVQDRAEDDGSVSSIILKRAKPGALKLARMVVALPAIMQALTDAHAALTGESDAPMADRLEALIERLAS